MSISKKNIYNLWSDRHIGVVFHWATLFTVILMTLLIPFDYLLFGKEGVKHFLEFRIFTILSITTFLFIIRELSKRNQEHRKKYYLAVEILGSFVILSYFYFLSNAKDEWINTIFFSNIMVMLFTFIISSCFRRSTFIIITASLIGECVLYYQNQIPRTYLYLLVIWTNVLMIFTYIVRVLVQNKLQKEHFMYNQIMGSKSALNFVIAPNKLRPEDIFPPEYRFSVVLIADWRGSQEISDRSTIEQIKNMNEIYYGIIQNELERCIPDGNYFMRTNGDELFVVCYQDDDVTKTQTVDRLLEFSHILSSTCFEEINSSIRNERITFDIGISFGNGLVGMLGAPGSKKADIMADFVGHAKRYETIAKNIRTEIGDINNRRNIGLTKEDYPTVVIDRALILEYKNHAYVETPYLSREVTVSKNRIENVFIYHPSQFWTAKAKFKIVV
ncbi:hypothetical protein OAB57_00190 [Bacteriovoracaceae bacterium]|nr:hypothetical protein [Bacteriovoracaceae bacterium]